MNSVYLFFQIYNEEEQEQICILRQKRKLLRDKSNPLDVNCTNFQNFFRLSKEAFVHVLQSIEDKLKDQRRSSAVPNIIKLAAVLRFLAEGSFQRGVASDFNICLAQPTFSLILNEMLEVMEDHLCPKWIIFNLSTEEENAAKMHFYGKCGIPGVVGCVDGTHIRILKPREEIQHLFYNRKGYHSINTMIVCDHQMKIRYINARYPGATHDSLIWNVSHLNSELLTRYENGERNMWLLGDCGYPLKQYLMTPFRSPDEGSAKARYNLQHSKGRNIIERVNGVLKSRFRCLSGSRQLQYSPEKTTKIINVCAALHNICITYKLRLAEEEIYEAVTPGNENFEHNEHVDAPDSLAVSIRERIVENLR